MNKNRITRFLSLLLLISMLASFMSFEAAADDPEEPVEAIETLADEEVAEAEVEPETESLAVDAETETQATEPSGYWPDHAAGAYDGGSGSKDDPWQIRTAEQLAYLAKMVSSKNAYTGKYFKLTDDIDLGGHYWVPIGTNSTGYEFKGIFIGNEHTISNMTVNGEYADAGLFGYITGAEISQLNIVDSSVTTTGNYAGAAVGTYTSNSMICGIHVYGTSVQAVKGAGGVIGNAQGASAAYVSGCSFENNGEKAGTVTGTGLGYANGIGGIVGIMTGSGGSLMVSGCWCKGSTVSGAGFAGGIVGNQRPLKDLGNTGAGTYCLELYDCYNTSAVSTTGNAAGGIVGSNFGFAGVVERCYNTGSVDASTSAGYASGIVGYAQGITAADCFNAGKVTGKYKYAFGAYSLTVAKCGYVQKNSEGTTAGTANAVTKYNSDTELVQNGINPVFKEHEAWNISDSAFPTLNPVHAAYDGKIVCHCDFHPTTVPAFTGTLPGGDGDSVETAYEIRTPEDLQHLAALVNANKYGTKVKYFKLTKDIDMTGYGMVPIGVSSSYPFRGVFMGNGHTISNLTIISLEEYCGLFGKVMASTTATTPGGEICQLNIDHATINGIGPDNMNADCYVGAVAGQITQNAKICNVHVTNSSVRGSNDVGGLIGYKTGSYNDQIVGCSFEDGTVINTSLSKTAGTGGILGGGTSSNNNTFTISGCWCTGSVIRGSLGYTGGIIGYNGKAVAISDCFNSSTVKYFFPYKAARSTSATSGAGGIIGYNSNSYTTLKNCVNIGTVSAPAGIANAENRAYSGTTKTVMNTHAGGIGGYVTGFASGGITKCFNAGDVTATLSFNSSSYKSSYSGAIGGYSVTNTDCGYLAGCLKSSTSTTTYSQGTSCADKSAFLTAVNGVSVAALTVENDAFKATFTQTHFDLDGNGEKDCHCVDIPQHKHDYKEQNTDAKYLKSAATCTSPAVYYYSCECGEIGTETFEYGKALGHSYGKPVCNENGTHTLTCTRQGCNYTETVDCTYDQTVVDAKYLKSAATCQSPAVYYYSCVCGDFVTGDEAATFTDGDVGEHKDGNGDHRCDTCDTILEYLVTFMSDGQQVGETKTVKNGESVAFPTAPEKDDYTFMGWSLTENGTALEGDSYTPSGDGVSITIYALWKENAPAAPVLADFNNAVKITDTDKETDNVSFSAILGEDYTVGKVVKGEDGKYTCTVTLNDAADYVNEYRNASFAEGKNTVVFEYGEDGWFVKTVAEITTSAKTVTVTFVQPTHTNGKFPAVEAITVALTENGTATVTLPDCARTDGKSGTWVYVLRGWHLQGDDSVGTWIDENVEVTVAGDVTFVGVWRLFSLTGDALWNFRDAMSIMDHIDNSKAFTFCDEQLEIANFDLDKRGTINYRDAMAIMSWADGSLTVFPFPDDNP